MDGGGSGEGGAPLALELRTFHCEEAFAYVVPPARSAAGHRAADWDVDKWLCKVRCSLCSQSGDDVPDGTALVRLHDAASGELFAECPLGVEVPIQAVVEPVVDSSRYFVLRVEDPVSKRHAFVGLGFASRDHSTDFKMALSEVQTARDRDKEAQRRRAAHLAAQQQQQQQAGAVPGGGADAADGQPGASGGTAPVSAPRQDLSLPEGAKIVLNVPSLAKRKIAAGGAGGAGVLPGGALAPPPPSPQAMKLGVLLPPPPKPGMLAPPPPAAQRTTKADDFGAFQ